MSLAKATISVPDNGMPSTDLKRRAFIGSIWSLLSNGGRQAIIFTLFIFIARNIGPADIGLVALAMIVVDIAGFASRFGQIEALQRQPTLSDRVTSTSFWMLAVGGPLTTALIVAGAVLSGRLISPDFRSVLILLSLLCTFQAWNAVPEALLKRKFDYRALAARTWLATLLGGIVGAFLAVRGFGMFALVGQRLTNSVVQTITLWVMLRWRPRLEFDLGEAKALLTLGFGVVWATASGIVNKRIVDGITGSVLGVAQLGHFYLGWRFYDFIVQFAVTPVTSVALSMFSNIQHDHVRLVRLYMRLSQFVALASLPIFFGLAATADLLVPVVLGARWTESIVVMQLLGFIMLAGTVNFFFAPAMIAIGDTRIIARQATLQTAATAVFVLIGVHFGIVGVLVAIIARAWVLVAYHLHSLRKTIGLSPAALLRVLAPPVTATAIMVAMVEVAKVELAPHLHPPVLLFSVVVIGAVTYGAALVIGDLVGPWRQYIRGVIDSLAGAVFKRTAGATGVAPALALSKGDGA